MPRYTNPILLKLKAAGLLPKLKRPGRKPLKWKGAALEALRQVYENDESPLDEIARRFKTCRGHLYYCARKYGWVRKVDARPAHLRRLKDHPMRAEWDAKREAGTKAYWEAKRGPAPIAVDTYSPAQELARCVHPEVVALRAGFGSFPQMQAYREGVAEVRRALNELGERL